MVSRTDLVRVSEHVYEVPAGYRDDMRVPARVYADDYILEQAEGDRSLEQLVNVATLPGVVGQVLAMPDMHQGYGFPIGGVAATALPDGVISPGGVGYDINCGVRLLSAAIDARISAPISPGCWRPSTPGWAPGWARRVPCAWGRRNCAGCSRRAPGGPSPRATARRRTWNTPRSGAA